MSNLVRVVEHSILGKRLFRPGQSILVAVSGGLDSMVLLHALHELSKGQQWRLVVAHFNHKLRGRQSDTDERFVSQMAMKLDLRFVNAKASPRLREGRGRLSLEMAARKQRHGFLAVTARRLGIPVVALAHHADDQVELFFLRLFRGAGAEGLAGMKVRNPSPVHRRIQLVRPFLDLPKSVLEAYAKEKDISFREDASNLSTEILRNRIRHELVPFLKEKFQPSLDKTIPRLMVILGAEAESVAENTRAWLAKKRRPAFEKMPVAIQRRCLQMQLHERLGAEVDYDLIEKLREKADQTVMVGPELSIYRDGSGLIHERKTPLPEFDGHQADCHLIGDDGEFRLDDVRVAWEVEPSPGLPLEWPKAGRGYEYFDADKVGSPIVLRHWEAGDRFQPIGMAASVKLQDLFSNLKTPRGKRHQLMVAATAAGEIWWVEGLRVSERFKLDKQTVRRLKWSWRRRQ